MKVRPFFLFLEFVVLSVVLTWLWLAWAQDAYAVFFEWMAGPLLRLAGVANVAESPAVKRFVNYVPFLVLMVITPRMNLRRRLLGTVIGVTLIFFCHVGVVAVEHLAQTRHRLTSDPFSTVFPAAMFADALPFILWAVIAKDLVRETLSRAFPVQATNREASPKSDG